MGQVANYFHASLHTFDGDARAGVIRHFHDAVGSNVSVKCWYDNSHDTFILECPAYMGPAVDDALRCIITRFVADGSAPGLKRFSESEIDNLNAIHLQAPEIATSASGCDQPAQSTHFVITDPGEGKQIKLFHLHELPARLLERTLAPDNERSMNSFSKGLTARAVRWDTRNAYVFYGRSGEEVVNKQEHDAPLVIPSFPQLEDLRCETDIPDELPAKSWDFAPGVGPIPVGQWLAGVGETRQVEPDQRPEMPKETRRLYATELENVPGRVRVPRGTVQFPLDQDAVDESAREEDQGHQPQGVSFNALLEFHASAGNMDDASSVEISGDASCDSGDETVTPAHFSDLLGRSGQNVSTSATKRPASLEFVNMPPTATCNENAWEFNASSRPPNVIVLDDYTNAHPRSSASVQQTQSLTKEECFLSYGSKYASVDTIGLHAPARDAAEWYDERHHKRQTLRRSLPVRSRHTADPSGAESRPPTALSSLNDHSMRTRPGFRPGFVEPQEASWANTVVEPNLAQGQRLIDDSHVVSRRTAPIPHGLHPARQAQIRSQRAAAAGNALPATEGNLIDIADSVLETPYCNAAAQPTLSMAVLNPVSSSTTDNPDGNPIERLKIIEPDFARRKNTMRQKAGKKHKKQTKSKLVATKVELPMPDPIPVLKVKKVVSSSPALPVKGEQAQRSRPETEGPVSAKHQVNPTAAAPSRIVDRRYSFGELIHKELQAIDDREHEDATSGEKITSQMLVASVGTLLLRANNDDLGNDVLNQRRLEKKLNRTSTVSRVDFFTRLTTSDAEAKVIADRATSYARARKSDTVHDIYVRGIDRTLFKIRVPGSSKADYTVTILRNPTAESYLHFPSHVHDARFQLLRPEATKATEQETGFSKSINAFITSMTSQGNTPGFDAFLESTDCTVERVLARQIFSLESIGGIFIELSKNWELSIEFVNSPAYNFYAVSKPEDEMRKEQRVWWDIRYETQDLRSAGLLEQQIKDMVSSIDAVGLSNEGPWIENPHFEEQETGAAEVDWFW